MLNITNIGPAKWRQLMNVWDMVLQNILVVTFAYYYVLFRPDTVHPPHSHQKQQTYPPWDTAISPWFESRQLLLEHVTALIPVILLPSFTVFAIVVSVSGRMWLNVPGRMSGCIDPFLNHKDNPRKVIPRIDYTRQVKQRNLRTPGNAAYITNRESV